LLWQKKDAGLLAYFIEQMSDPAEKRRSWDRYHEVRGFAESEKCRHKIICNHFGEKVAWQNCGACDVCLPAIDCKSSGQQRVVRETKSRTKKTPISEHLPADPSLLTALKQWRLERSRTDKVPAFVVLHDSTLEHLCVLRPNSAQQLRNIPGIGETKLERYGNEILAVLRKN
jgi:ATP-dependent DNA helicase RecQ